MPFLSSLSHTPEEDPVLTRFRETAQALRMAYRYNREAERYHMGGALRAAQRQARLARAHARNAEGLLGAQDLCAQAASQRPMTPDPACVP